MLRSYIALTKRIALRLPALVGLRKLYTYSDRLQPGSSSFSHGSRPMAWHGHSLFIRQLDTGSSNGAELSISALQNGAYDMRRKGFQLVESPRKADMVLVTGSMTLNLVDATLATFDAMPEQPRYVVTVGDDTDSGGMFRDSYAVLGQLPDPLMRDPQHHIGHVPGLVPRPDQILNELIARTVADS